MDAFVNTWILFGRGWGLLDGEMEKREKTRPRKVKTGQCPWGWPHGGP